MYSPRASIYLIRFQFSGEAESNRWMGDKMPAGEGLAEHALWGVNVSRNQGRPRAGVELGNEAP